ncbi:MAG: hypothetical protein AB7Q29_15965 [Vicinamibacterales bacterium]
MNGPFDGIIALLAIVAALVFVHETSRRWVLETLRAGVKKAGDDIRGEFVKWAGITALALIGGITADQVADSLTSRYDSAADTVVHVYAPAPQTQERTGFRWPWQREQVPDISSDSLSVDLLESLGPVIGVGLPGARSRSRASGSPPAFEYQAPNTPVIDVTVTDTSTIRLTIQEPVFSGDDTHESTDWAIEEDGGDWSTPLASSITDTDSLEAITFVDNADFTNGATLKARVRVTGVNGGASAYDTIVFTNTVVTVENLFRCDWPTTGTTAAAIQDCGPVDWPGFAGSAGNPGFSVVAAASSTCSGWPTTNVFRMSYPGSGDPFGFVHATEDSQIRMDTLQASETRAYRWYVCMVANKNNGVHGIHDGFGCCDYPSADINIAMDIAVASGEWRFSIPLNGGIGQTNTIRYDAAGMQLGDLYMVQYSLHATAAGDSFDLAMEVYDVVGDSVYLTADDIIIESFNGVGNGNPNGTPLSTDPRFLFGDRNSTAQFAFGQSGLDVRDEAYTWGDFGGLLICKPETPGGFCGAYPVAGVEN